MWDECSHVVVWTSFGIAFLWDWNENWPFPALWPLLSFPNCWHIECSTFTASSFRIWKSSTGILSPLLALFIVMLPKTHLTLHSRMSGSRWVITASWLSGSWRSILYSSFVYSCHLLVSSASHRSIPLLSFIVPIIYLGMLSCILHHSWPLERFLVQTYHPEQSGLLDSPSFETEGASGDHNWLEARRPSSSIQVLQSMHFFDLYFFGSYSWDQKGASYPNLRKPDLI